MKTAFRLLFTDKNKNYPCFCRIKDPSEIPIGLLAWQGQKDSNPRHVVLEWMWKKH